MLLCDFLSQSAKEYPDKVALVTEKGQWTYRQLDDESDGFARALLRRGLRRGDRVAIYLGNTRENVVATFGALKAGGAFVVLNPGTRWNKLLYILSNARAAALVTSRSVLGKETAALAACGASVSQIYLTDPDVAGGEAISFAEATRDVAGPSRGGAVDIDLAALIYTSGSTGVPKGVALTHLNMVSATRSITTYLENVPDDVVLNVLPLSFDYGLYQVINMFVVGGRTILEESFNYPYDVVKKLNQYGVTGFPCVPTIYAMLSKMERVKDLRFPTVRYLTNTGSHLGATYIDWMRKTFPGARIYAMYGLTECKRVSYLPPEELDRRPGSVGKAMPNVETYIAKEDGTPAGPNEVGELVVRGSNVMQGYWEDPELTARVLKPGRYPWEKELRTGDLFRSDDDGFLYFIGRKDDVIKSRGEKVSPKEVESVIGSLAGVQEAAVIGAPDEILGQAVLAHVVRNGSGTVTAAEVIRHCAEHLEPFMVPKAVFFWDLLPRSSAGKIDRTALRERGQSQGPK